MSIDNGPIDLMDATLLGELDRLVVCLTNWARMIHIFQWFHSQRQDGRAAIEDAGKWMAAVMARQ